MKRKFNITMYVPLGNRKGTISFDKINSQITGTLCILGNEDSFTGTIDENGFIEFKGKITSLLHSFYYCAKGKIAGYILLPKIV